MVVITSFFAACHKETQAESEQTSLLPQLVTSQTVTATTAEYLEQMFEPLKRQQNMNGDIDISRFNFNFAQSQLHTYRSDRGDTMRAITCTLRLSDTSFVDFGVHLATNGSISNNVLLITRNITDEQNFRIIYYDAQNSTRIAGLQVANGLLFSIDGTNLATPRGCFGSCVGNMINSFTNGEVLETITGLGCIAFGSQCAIAMTVVCAWNCR